jgi:hypothetical protein
VEYDLQAPAERISDAAQRLQAWNMIAAFEARDHGFCHPKSLRQLLLSLACMSAKLEQAVSALGGDCDAVIRQALSPSGRAGCALAGSAKVSDARFRRLSIDRFWRILLQKSFWGDARNFSGPLMRFARGDMRDHIVSHKNDHGASYWRYGNTAVAESAKNQHLRDFRRRSIFDFCNNIGAKRTVVRKQHPVTDKE